MTAVGLTLGLAFTNAASYAAPKTALELEQRLSQGMNTAIAWDASCRNALNSNSDIRGSWFNESGNQTDLRPYIDRDGDAPFEVSGANNYRQSGWVSSADRGNTESPVQIEEGQQDVPLRINHIWFLCGMFVQPDPTNNCTVSNLSSFTGQYFYNDNQRWVTSPLNANDRAPNIVNDAIRSCMAPHSLGNGLQFLSVDVAKNTGTPGNPTYSHVATINLGGAIRTVDREDDSRYWIMDPLPFTYTHSEPFEEDTELRFILQWRRMGIFHRITSAPRNSQGWGLTYVSRTYGPGHRIAHPEPPATINSAPWSDVVNSPPSTYYLALSVNRRPRITPATTFPTFILEGEIATATHTVNNPEGSSTTVRVERGLFHDANDDGQLSTGEQTFGVVTTEQTSSNTTISFGSSTRQITLADFPTGRVCAYTRIISSSPAVIDENTNNPAVVCAQIGRKPHIQISGGDLVTRGRSGNPGEVNAPSVQIGWNRFGSWMEYGVFGSGTVRSHSSGSLAARLTPSAAAATALTFANTPTPVGNFRPVGGTGVTPTLPTDWTNQTVSGNSLNVNSMNHRTRYVHTGSLMTLNGGGVPNGNATMLESSGTVIIAPGTQSGIRYESTTKNNISDFSQMIIKANNIIIRPGVTNIDAWLIADNAIVTCSSSNTIPSAPYFSGLQAGVCNSKLRINGFVQASQLFARRTSGAGETATTAGRRDPAEVINMRADTYIWAYGEASRQGAVRTMSVKSLPPRF